MTTSIGRARSVLIPVVIALTQVAACRSPAASKIVPIEPRPKLSGMFVYAADAAIFTECLAGDRWPVAQEADYLDLERAYLATRSEPFQRLLVEIEGHLVDRPNADPSVKALRRTLIVDRFISLDPARSCSK
jgi:copper homeostasis protein (lipoprotein)